MSLRSKIAAGGCITLLVTAAALTAAVVRKHLAADRLAQVFITEHQLVKLSGWAHVVGCPHIGDQIGQNNVVLWFSDGESVAIDINKTSEEHRADLSKYIGETKGYTYVAKCGSDT